MPYQPFTMSEVKYIFELSEGKGISGQHVGHAGRKHVSITKKELAARQSEQRRGGLHLSTGFVRFRDQIEAALAVLNDPANDALLEAFRIRTKIGGPLTIEHARISNPVPMRYAIGGTTAIYPCEYFTLWGRKVEQRPREIHVVSFFGTMGEFG